MAGEVNPLPIILGILIPITVMVGLVICVRPCFRSCMGKNREEQQVRYIKEMEDEIVNRVIQRLNIASDKVVVDIEAQACSCNTARDDPATATCEVDGNGKINRGNIVNHIQSILGAHSSNQVDTQSPTVTKFNPQRYFRQEPSSPPPTFEASQGRLSLLQSELDSRAISQIHGSPVHSELPSSPVLEAGSGTLRNSWANPAAQQIFSPVSAITEPGKVYSTSAMKPRP